MTEPVTIPAAPALATIPNVQLMQAGTWALMTGEATFTAEDIANAVAALDCPAVRRPVLKLGHVDPRFDGEPAIGWIANMHASAEGDVLVGDYAGMPAWLGDVMASAYPDRSIEGAWNLTCQLGHVHPFVITAVALLGVSPPGVGTLTSIQDVGALYGVAASTTSTPPARTFRLTATGGRMPTRTVAAQTSTEDVRRAYYDGPAANSWDWWIQAVYLDPPQLIVCNDADGHLYRVGYSVTGDAVTFADPVRVRIEYVDAPEPSGQTAAAAASPQPAAVYASRGDSRPKTPRAAEPAAGTTHTPDQEEDTVSDALSEALRQRLGITDAELSEEEILAKLDEQLATDPPPTPAVPDGSVVVPAPALADLQAQAAAGARAAEQLRVQERDRIITDAVNAGKIPPARRAHWTGAYDRDPEGTRDYLASAPQIVPTTPAGYTGDETSGDADAEFDQMFSRSATSREA